MPWGALRVEVPESLGDEPIGRLALLGRGAHLIPSGDGRTTLRIYLSSPARARSAEPEARRLLESLGLAEARESLVVEQVEDESWVERYRASLKPFGLGTGFIVFPDGKRRPAGERRGILLVPGRAFGTGEHATTRLCAEELERRVTAGSRWLDLGCGTAVLSIVAHHNGAGTVQAVDVDPEATAVATEVLRANDLEGRIEIVRGGLEAPTRNDWDGIVANIHAHLFLEAAGRIACLLAGGGWLIASGFTVDDAAAVREALADAGLRTVAQRTREPWALLVAGRAGQP